MITTNSEIKLIRPFALSCDEIANLLDRHFNGFYQFRHSSKLLKLSIHAIYQCVVNESKRFDKMTLLPIKTQSSFDKISKRIGDVEIRDERQRSFEAVEVKYGIPITLQLVHNAYEKFKCTPVDRYYLLSTVLTDNDELEKINAEIKSIKNVHGCQLIVNGIMPTLKYYLRLLADTFEFVNNYVNLLEADNALKFEHKERWNMLISEMR